MHPHRGGQQVLVINLLATATYVHQSELVRYLNLKSLHIVLHLRILKKRYFFRTQIQSHFSQRASATIMLLLQKVRNQSSVLEMSLTCLRRNEV